MWSHMWYVILSSCVMEIVNNMTPFDCFFFEWQVAQDIALGTGDTLFILELLEVAGDLFFNSMQDREKAICFYRVRL